jgi:TolA-binding protein
MRRAASLSLLAAACLLAGCAARRGTPDDEPTLRTLAARRIAVEKDSVPPASEDEAIAAYKQFLAVTAKEPKSPQRAEAMRRIGDLEMDGADARSADAAASAAAPDYRAAIARYREFLKTYPDDPGNDRVLYQLARAQEQGGDLDGALKTLDVLVRAHPSTKFRDEAEVRRGELLFGARDYAGAEKAYATVLDEGDASAYHDRALYMHGWSLFKQGRLEDGLRSFFGVLDLKLAAADEEGASDERGDGRDADGDADADKDRGGLAGLSSLSRAERELVEDTFRVASISLANLQGAQSIPPYIDSPARRAYEFRVYEQLGELYIRQERVKDAADAFGAFARLHPLHAQAPVLQARVIDIYERNGFATLALEAKREYVARYGSASEFRRANPQGWRKAQPLVKVHVAELARHFHAAAQKGKDAADYREAARWYREYIASFPDDPQAARHNFLLAELLFEQGGFADAAAEYEKTAYAYPPHDKSADAGYAALLSLAQQRKTAAPAELPALQRTSVASALRFARAFPADARAAPVLADAAERLYALNDGEHAAEVAQRVLDLQPAAPDAQRRVAWTVLAHVAFERGEFASAESRYAELLRLVPEKDAARGELVERQAASIYKQGEAARADGRLGDAVAAFRRVGAVAPQSAVRANAQYDAAAALIALKDWDGAAKSLEDFRRDHPNHPLNAEVGGKLALAYVEQGRWGGAAAELEKLAAASKDPAVARDAQWRAAEYHEKAGARAAAARAYERYLAANP